MGVKDLLGKILLAHPDQYTPEHLLKPENYQKVEKNCLSPLPTQRAINNWVKTDLRIVYIYLLDTQGHDWPSHVVLRKWTDTCNLSRCHFTQSFF